MASKQEWINTTCPKCSSAQTFYAYKVVDVVEDPEIKEKLFQGELNVFSCVQCGTRLHYDEYLVYSDSTQGLIVNVFSKDYERNERELVQKIFAEVESWVPDEALPNFIVFGYQNLARIIALMEKRLKEMGLADKQALLPEDYQRLFVVSEGLLRFMEVPDYQKLYAEIEPKLDEAGRLLKEQKHQEAEKSYLAILQIFPDFYEANLNIGLLYFNVLGQPDRAVPYLEKCRSVRPNESDIHFALGQTYLKLHIAQKASDCFHRAVIASPQSSLAWFNLGLGLWMQGKREEGLDVLERSLALSYNSDDRILITRTIRSLTEKM